jgi:DNA/RNA endonuclease YhcR with UshA esterase domain
MKHFTKSALVLAVLMLFTYSSTVLAQNKARDYGDLPKEKVAAMFDRINDLSHSFVPGDFVPSKDAILFEGFESWPPAGWTLESPTGDDWVQDDGTSHGPGSVYEGSYAAMYDNYNISSGDYGSMTTPAFDVSGLANPMVSFYWWNDDSNYNPATLEVLTSTDGVNFTSQETIDTYGSGSWVAYNLAIGNDVTHVKLTATSDYGIKNTFVDAFEVKDLNLNPELAVNYNNWNAGLVEAGTMETADGFVAFNSNDFATTTLEFTNAYLSGSSAFSTTFDVAAANAAMVTPPDEAIFTLSLYDSYGDGWNGGSLDVLVNGTVVLDDITVVSGSQADFSLMVANGDLVETEYTAGSYSYENSYTFFDNVGNEIITDGASGTPTGISFTAEPVAGSYMFGFSFEPTEAGEQTATLTIESNGGTQEIELVGIAYAAGSMVESFEGGVPPNGWEANILNGTYNWEQAAVPAIGEYSAMFNSWSASSGYSAELITPPLDLTAKSDNMLYFYYGHPTTYSGYEDMLEVYVTEDNGANWTLLDEIMMQDLNWHLMSYDLSAYSGDEFKVKFVAVSDWGQNIYIDHVIGPKPVSGNLIGFVYDEYTGESIEGAEITLGTQSSTSNSFGLYAIEQIPVGTYTVTCEADGYMTVADEVEITIDNATQHDFYLIRPAVFNKDVDEYVLKVEPNEQVAKSFTISNDAIAGADDLVYEVSIDFVGKSNSGVNYNLEGNAPTAKNSEFGPGSFGPSAIENPTAPKETWDVLFNFNAAGAGQPGIETDGEYIYTSDWRSSATNTFYKYTMDGTFVEAFNISGATQIRDMAYDGEYFYGSAASNSLYKLDLANQTLVETISVSCSGVTGVRHIAYDPELDGGNGGFWVGNWNELGAIDMNGNQLVSNLSMASGLSLYGSAYDAWSEDGPYLWLFSQAGSGVDMLQFDIATQSLTGVSHNCSDAPGFISGSIAGGAATYISDGKLVLLANIQQDPNLIVGYELAPVVTETWLTVTGGATGTVAPGESTTVDLFFDATGMVDVVKNANIVITHNGVVAKDAEAMIPAEMTVTPFIHDVSIFDIQFTEDPAGASALIDTTVRTTGVITAGDGGSVYFLQDVAQSGSWNGIKLYSPDMTFAIGDEVSVVGVVDEYYDMTEIIVDADMTSVLSSGNDLPAPLFVQTGSFGEQYEGLLVVAENAECTVEPNSYGEWMINDGSGEGMVDDFYYAYAPTLGNSYNVVGPLDYSYGNFKILPRGAGDVEDISNELLWPPLNLTADIQHRDVVLNWHEPQQYGWHGYYQGAYYISWVDAERATYFDLGDFGFNPVTISQVSHQFYESGSYPWNGADSAVFKIYDADGATLLWESDVIHVDAYPATTVVDVDPPLDLTDNFFVAVEALDDTGYPISLADSDLEDVNGYAGGPGAWTPWLEWSTMAYMTGDGPGGKVALEPSNELPVASQAGDEDYAKLKDSEIAFAPKYLKSYNLYRNGSLYAEGITDLTYTDADLGDGVYTYHVTTVWTTGESAPSNVVSVQLFYGSMDGMVTDAEYGTPIADATVASADGLYTTTTDETGYYSFDEVHYGTYTFNVTADGYLPGAFDNIEIVQNENTTADFGLERHYVAPQNVAVDPYYGIISWNPPGGMVYDDDFEGYSVGEYLAVQSNAWTTWDNAPGTATDALISDEMAQSGAKSVKVEGSSDLVLEMGNQTSGTWEVNISLFMADGGDGGYYNLLHDFDGGNSPEWAIEIYFDNLGNGILAAAGDEIAFTFTPGEWVNMKTVIDLDADYAEQYVNGSVIHNWQWSLLTDGTPGLNQLGAMDVFAASLGGSAPLFYMDDVSYGPSSDKEVVVSKDDPQLTHYNVYLNDYMVTETNDLEHMYEGLDIDNTYTGGVSAMYSYMGDMHESDIVEVEFTFLQTDILAPTNLAAVVENFNEVKLSWDIEDAGRYLETFLIYRDGEEIAQVDGNTFSYTDIVGEGTYEYQVQAFYTGFLLSEPSEVVSAEVILPAPRNLVGNLVNEVVTLQWEEPQISITGDEFSEDFEAGIPADWTFVDEDGDGYNWELADAFTAHSGTNCMYSASYLNGIGPLTPDNYMITPQLLVGTGAELSFWYVAQDPAWPGDYMEIRVSTTDNDPASFTETVASVTAGSSYAQEVVDLSAFEGEMVYIAFVHTDCTDYFYINVDDIVMSNAERVNAPGDYTLNFTAEQPLRLSDMSQTEIDVVLAQYYEELEANQNGRALIGYNVYRNDGVLANTANTFYIDNTLVGGDYDYYVTAVYSGDFESAPSDHFLVEGISTSDVSEDAISVYPNPAKEMVNITVSDNVESLRVLNYVGQVVYEQGITSEKLVQVSTDRFEEGAYIVQFTTNDGELISKRFVVLK